MDQAGLQHNMQLAASHDAITPSKREWPIYILLFLIVLAGVASRAALVPWIHDEAASLFWYVEKGEFLPYHSLWDAGNHHLNSALGIVAHRLVGLHLLGIRIFSVLAFCLYAWAAWRIGQYVSEPIVRWCLWPALLLCPFLIEFFSLFRGYGMAMAFWLVAIDGLLRWFHQDRSRHMVQLLVALIFANAAVLTMLPVSGVVVLFVAVRSFMQWRTWSPADRRKQVILIGALGVLPMLAGALMTWEFRRRGLLYHGSTDGLMEVTVAPLVELVTGSGSLAIPLIILLIAVAISAFIIKAETVVRLLVVIFAGELLLRVLAASLLNVNYPEDRAALHLVPVAILLIAFTIDRWSQWSRSLRYFSLLLLALPIRSIMLFNLDHAMLWPEQSVPAEWVRKIAVKQQEDPKRPFVLGVYHQQALAVPYMARTHGLVLPPPESRGFLRAEEDLRIVGHGSMDHARQGYSILDACDDRLFLLERQTDHSMTMYDRIEPGDITTRKGLHLLWEDDGHAAEGARYIEVMGTLDCGRQLADIYLIVLHAGDRTPRHEEGMSLRLMRPYWHDEAFQLVKWIDPDHSRSKLYFWDPQGLGCDLRELQVAVWHRP